MSDPQRLHPAAVLEYLIKNIRSLIELLLPGVVILFTTPLRREWIWGFIALLLMIYIGFATLYWLRYNYYVFNDELRVEHGIFTRKKTYIPLERIQSVQVSAGVVQRIFGLVKLEVQTAGGGFEAEVSLPAITLKQADILQARLGLSALGQEKDGSEELFQQERKLSFKELMIAASTSNGLGVVLVGATALISQVEKIFPDLNIYEMLGNFISGYAHRGVLVWVTGILLLILLAWLLSMLGMVLSQGGFQLIRAADRLIVSRGLIEKKQVSIPLKRIQAIKITEGFLRQPFGLLTIHAVSAGYGDESGVDALIFPLLPQKDVKGFFNTFLPEYEIEEEITPLSAAVKNRYRLIYTLPALLVTIPAAIFLPYGYLLFFLPVLAFLIGVQQYRDTGWRINGNQLLVRTRIFGRVTTLTKRQRVQFLKLSQNPLQRRKGLYTFAVTVASTLGGIRLGLKGIDENSIREIMDWVYADCLPERY